MTEALRAHLHEQLTKKVEAHGLVVWDDPEGHYTKIAESVCPPTAKFASFDGSYYELRHRIEGALSGERPPPLVVYLPVEAPPSDPLEEIRAAGHRFRLKLPTLVRQALAGRLTDERIELIGCEARTLGEAEAAITGGNTPDVRLISLLGATDTTQMVLAVMCAAKDQEIAEEGAWPEVAAMLGRTLGNTLEGEGEELRRAAMRQMILSELAERAGGLAAQLESAWSVASAQQTKTTLAILDSWRHDQRLQTSYARLATDIESELSLRVALSWHPRFDDLDSVPAIDELALGEAVRSLETGAFEDAGRLARARMTSSLWVRASLEHPLEGAEVWGPRWRVVDAIASLRGALAKVAPPSGVVAEYLDWYVEHGWRVDRDHRRMELAVSELHVEGRLEAPIGEARTHYERWLDDVLERFTSAAASGGVDVADILRQVDVHGRFVTNTDGLTAYVWVDALRLEIGRELMEALRPLASTIELHAGVASAPTITPVGMASLCPGSDIGLSLDVDGRKKLVVKVGEREVKSVRDRIELLRAAHGEVVDLSLSDVVGRGERELERGIAGASLVLVRSQEMDAAGESGMLAVTWANLDAVKQQLVRAVARLAQAGVSRFVIAADHGFVVLSRGLRSDRVVDAPRGGHGELHRRGWVGRGAATTPSTLRVALAETGARSDLDFIVPRTLAVFAGPGTRQFFHGGLSPQELLVPVIVAETQKTAAPKERRMDIAVAGNRLTTGVFAVTISFEPDLFTSELEVRVVARRRATKQVIARPVSGEGFDAISGAATLASEGLNVLTFQVIADLERGEEVEIGILDARTDRELASTIVTASAPIRVEDDLA